MATGDDPGREDWRKRQQRRPQNTVISRRVTSSTDPNQPIDLFNPKADISKGKVTDRRSARDRKRDGYASSRAAK